MNHIFINITGKSFFQCRFIFYKVLIVIDKNGYDNTLDEKLTLIDEKYTEGFTALRIPVHIYSRLNVQVI